MQKLIFDIETLAPAFDELPQDIKDALIEKFSQEHKEKSRSEIISLIEEKLALLPQFSQVLSVAFYNPDTQRGAVYFWGPSDWPSWVEGLIEFKRFSEEKEILEEFWRIVPNYQEVISYNGNNFDVPFLLFRSFVHRLRPTVNLLDKEYHIDLYQKLSFERRIQLLSLKFLSHSLGLEDPKKNMDGKKIREVFKAGDYQSLVKYALGDVLTTAKIYELWNNYLRFY